MYEFNFVYCKGRVHCNLNYLIYNPFCQIPLEVCILHTFTILFHAEDDTHKLEKSDRKILLKYLYYNKVRKVVQIVKSVTLILLMLHLQLLKVAQKTFQHYYEIYTVL